MPEKWVFSPEWNLSVSKLNETISAQVKESSLLPSISEQVLKGASHPELLRSIFSVPKWEARLGLVQNEFLTLTVERGTAVTAEDISAALRFYRVDLFQKKALLLEVNKFSSLEDLLASQQASSVLCGTLADVSGLGIFGSPRDVPALEELYKSLSQTIIEPVIFTAVSRAFLSLRDYQALERLLQEAPASSAREAMVSFVKENNLPVTVTEKIPETATLDFAVLTPALSKTSRVATRHLDFSVKATQDWVAIEPNFADRSVFPVSVPQSQAWISSPTTIQLRPFDLSPRRTGAQIIDLSVSPVQSPLAHRETGLPGEPLRPLAAEEPMPNTAEMTPEEAATYNPVVPALEGSPRVNIVSKRYPSGLKDEESIIRNWSEYFRNGYFRPRDQVEAIEGMSAAKANNVMEYLYYMSLEEAERVILNPLLETGRLPDFMYDNRLIAGTKRLPAGYYKNKFNENVKRFVELAEEDGTIYTHNAELADLATSMADYTFEQGFRFQNNPQLTAGLRHNWRELVAEIRRNGLKANREVVNRLWRAPVDIGEGATVSLKEYFTQTRPTAFFREGRMPEFFLNSPKWVSWENERRNLAAEEFVSAAPAVKESFLSRIQKFFVLGKPSHYLTLEQFGEVMTGPYKQSFGQPTRVSELEYSDGVPLEDSTPSSLEVRVNNFDKVGGVCQMSFSDGGYMGPVEKGYDGTSKVLRFEPIEFTNVPVVTFDLETLAPRVLTLQSVPYLKDIKKPDLDQVRASTMVGDGLDPTRDLLSVRRAELALFKIPHLKATLYPHSRLKNRTEVPAYMDGGGLAGYLALFTPDFYPLKKIYRLRFDGWKLRFEPQYFVRKEIPALAGSVHRDRLTFTGQVEGRVVQDPAASTPAPVQEPPVEPLQK